MGEEKKNYDLIKQSEKVDHPLKECNELISVFVSSIKTAQSNLK